MPKKQETFESAMSKLEKVITRLEDDELTLDKALASFEEGIGLMKTCDKHLCKAEGKLKELVSGEDGAFVEKVLGISLDSVTGGEDFDE